MPNWCDNILEIKGPSEVLEEFAKVIGEMDPKTETINGEFLFEKYLPLNEFMSADVQSVYWGTKWDLEEAGFEYRKGDEEISIWFSSAWGPPIEFVQYISSRFPELVCLLRFYESGMNFAGEIAFLSGQKMFEKDYVETTKKKTEEKIVFIEDHFDEWIRETIAEQEAEMD